jgi:hypothetical protein
MVSPVELSGQSPSNSGKNRRMKTVLLLIGFIVVNIDFADAQQSAKVSLVGVLRGDSSPNPSVEAFQQALRDLGYLEGKISSSSNATPKEKLTACPNSRRS